MILVVMGVCGCGKSSIGRRLAAHMNCAFLEGDDYHPDTNRQKMTAGIPLTDADRWPWLERIASEMAKAKAQNVSLVVACSALKQSYRDRLRSGTEATFIHLTGPPDMIRERMAARADHFMPTGLLDSQLATLEPAGSGETLHEISIAPPSDAVALDIITRLNL